MNDEDYVSPPSLSELRREIALQTAVHAAIVVGSLFFLVLVAERGGESFEMLYAEMGQKIPRPAAAMLAAGSFLYRFWPFTLTFVVLALGADAWIFRKLRMEIGPAPSVFWSLIVTLFLIAFAGLIGICLLIPYLTALLMTR